jgi:ribosomal protein S27E
MSLLERDQGSYLFSCDRCGRVTHDLAMIYFGERGEHVDLCGRCLAKPLGGEGP